MDTLPFLLFFFKVKKKKGGNAVQQLKHEGLLLDVTTEFKPNSSRNRRFP